MKNSITNNFDKIKNDLKDELQLKIKSLGVSRVVEITGLKQPYISSWMHGHRNMSLEKMVDIYNKLSEVEK